jgi:ribosome recycling factor
MVSAVEKAIRESTLGLNPMTDGTTVRVPLPELNEERRRELVKIAHQYAENGRIAARHVRRDGMETLKRMEKDGEMSQDDSRTKSDDVQKLTDKTIEEIDSMLAEKEQEIMHV